MSTPSPISTHPLSHHRPSAFARGLNPSVRFNSTSGSNPGGPRPAVTLRTHPWRFITTFGVIHPLLHYTLFLPPIYLLCSQTGFATWLLAGPSGAALLRTRVPDWIPNGSLYGLKDTRERVSRRWKGQEEQVVVESGVEKKSMRDRALGGLISAGLDRIPDKYSAIGEKGKEYIQSQQQGSSTPSTTTTTTTTTSHAPTIEDWMETTIYKSIASTIRTGKSLRGLISSYRDNGDKPPPSMDEIKSVKDDELSQSSGARKWFAGQVKDHTQDMRIRTVVDGLAAYLVVKVSFARRAAARWPNSPSLIPCCRLCFPSVCPCLSG